MKSETPQRLAAALERPHPLLSIFFTAGYPRLNDTLPIVSAIEKSGADLVEIGIPYSDPVADGPVIQQSSAQALQNGMSVEKLFEQLQGLRRSVSIPVFLMGYLSPVLAFGVERFAEAAARCGIDGVILPDLPVEEYRSAYRPIFAKAGLDFVGLIAPTTPDERAREIDRECSGFLYAVGGTGVTGNVISDSPERDNYLSRLSALKLSKPLLVGFGVRDGKSFASATRCCRGAIVGTAFIEELDRHGVSEVRIAEFVKRLRGL